MRRTAVSLLLLAACGRDLDLPEEPAAVPESLAPLAGFYAVSLVSTDPFGQLPADELVSLPHNAVATVMHLPDVTGDGAEPVVGFLEDNFVDLRRGQPYDDSLDQLLALLSQRSFFGAKIAEQLFVETSDGTALTGDVLPGTAGFRIISEQPSLSVCPGGTPRFQVLAARKRCNFDPSISGVYRGQVAAGRFNQDVCETSGAANDGIVALGFFGDLLLGMRWPENAELIVGDWNTELSLGTHLSLAFEGGWSAGQFSIVESEGNLSLNWVSVNLEDLTSCEARTATRLVSGELEPACLDDELVDDDRLGVSAIGTDVGGQRYLDLTLSWPDGTPVGAARPGLEVDVREAGALRALVPVAPAETPAGVTRRYPIDAPGRTPSFYEVVAGHYRRVPNPITGVEDLRAVYAPLSCLRDTE